MTQPNLWNELLLIVVELWTKIIYKSCTDYHLHLDKDFFFLKERFGHLFTSSSRNRQHQLNSCNAQLRPRWCIYKHINWAQLNHKNVHNEGFIQVFKIQATILWTPEKCQNSLVLWWIKSFLLSQFILYLTTNQQCQQWQPCLREPFPTEHSLQRGRKLYHSVASTGYRMWSSTGCEAVAVLENQEVMSKCLHIYPVNESLCICFVWQNPTLEFLKCILVMLK